MNQALALALVACAALSVPSSSVEYNVERSEGDFDDISLEELKELLKPAVSNVVRSELAKHNALAVTSSDSFPQVKWRGSGMTPVYAPIHANAYSSDSRHLLLFSTWSSWPR